MEIVADPDVIKDNHRQQTESFKPYILLLETQ